MAETAEDEMEYQDDMALATLAQYKKLALTPDEVHLFCPRQNDKDFRDYDDPTEAKGWTPDEIIELVRLAREAEERTQLAITCLKCYALSGSEPDEAKEFLNRRIDHCLKNCNVCIISYYRGKRGLFEELRNEYDEEQVQSFAQFLGERELARLKPALASITKFLKDMPEEKRRLSALKIEGVMTIAESLCCNALLTNEELLREHFDEAFKMVQGKKGLGVLEYVPATTRFLFDPNSVRCLWASQTWPKFDRPPTKIEFDWSMRDALVENLQRASAPDITPNQVLRLWHGFYLILDKLDSDTITHSLRALDQDFCRLLLEHFRCRTAGLRFMLHAFRTLLLKAPTVFWESMGTISSTTVIEQIFNNPHFDDFLLGARASDPFESSALKDMLGWIDPFVRSLQSANQPPACQALAFQLLDRLQHNRFLDFARSHCYQTGISVLQCMVQTYTKNRPPQETVARVILSNVQEIVGTFAATLLDPPCYVRELHQVLLDRLPPHIEIVTRSLEFDCDYLKKDFEIIESKETVDHSIITCSNKLWSAVTNRLQKVEDVVLAKGALIACTPLVGLEKFRSKDSLAGSPKFQFNETFGRLSSFVHQILEHIADFTPSRLDDLLKVSDTATALISSLLSADPSVSKTAVEVIKNVSGQSGRKEAISHIFQAFFATAINAFNFSYRRISNSKTFASAPLVVKIGKDVVDVLCDPQSGILRTRALVDRRDVTAIENLWKYLWEALSTIFKNMEGWSTKGTTLGKSEDKEFCRDTMQFAESLFGFYDVFASALSTAKEKDIARLPDEKLENFSPQTLLKYPTITLGYMIFWLRFRDEYLADICVKLVLLMLRRLGELELKVPSATLSAIENVCVKDKSGKEVTKTVLKAQQKAELYRALETYLGRPLVERQAEARKQSRKQSTLLTWSKSGPGKDVASESSVQEVSDEYGDSEILDEDMIDISRAAELAKFQFESKHSDALKAAKKPKTPAVDVLSFREKREKEKEEKKKRDAIEIARQKKNQALLAGVDERNRAGKKSDLGYEGKDHGGQSMMVSSSSESSDDETKAVFGKPIQKERQGSSNSITDKLLVRQGPVKKVKQLRSAKDMRARLAPDLSGLHRTILSWDFFSESNVPPSSAQEDYSLVSSVFRTPSEYQRTFQPLLILEAWQGFRKDKEEGRFEAFAVKVSSRLNVDAFVEVSTSMPMKQGQELQLGESDVVLISKSKNPATDSTQPHCLARISRVVRKGGEMQISYRVNSNNPLLSSLNPNTELWGTKISSLTPLEREYGALSALQYYDLCDEIIKAKPSPILDYSEKILDPLVSNYQVNPAQAKAVKSALDNDAFTLIQGPPGSGKTKTIVALVGALLTNSLGNKGVAISRPSGMNGVGGLSQTSKKLLVCAPSNAAVDELVMRLKQGVKTLNGRTEKISVVRLGRSDAINANVKDVTLDELVQAKLNTMSADSKPRTIGDMAMEHKAASEKLIEVRSKLDESRAKGLEDNPEVGKMEREFDLLKRKKAQLGNEIDAARERENSGNRDSELSRRKIQQEILDGAHVLCATLSGSGHDMFQNLSIEFETVIIDEAAQSIELSALIPLKYGCSKCILVGDPKQLPPTVLSRAAAKFQYEQSLFVRMQANHANDVHLLDTQYRMHPEISRFPSKTFYQSKLQDGPGMAKLRTRPWHQSEILGPYRFFDVQGAHQNAPKGHSLINVAEVNVALQLYGRLIKDCRGYDFGGKVGIITPYKSQLRELKSRFSLRYGEGILTQIEFNTTDAFQGRESEIIIFSCVRAAPGGGIGFLADIRRMNVGLTRAKSSLWVLGNAQSLSRGEFWNELVQDSRARNLFTGGDILGLFTKPLLVLDTEMTDAPAEGVIMISSSSSSANPSPIEPPRGPASSRHSSKATTPRDSPAEAGKQIPARPRAQNGSSSDRGKNLPTGPSNIRNKQRSIPSDRGKSIPTGPAKLQNEHAAKNLSAPPDEVRPPKKAEDGVKTKPTGPSGGPWMTNDLRMCFICGSNAHYSHECDNLDAKVASWGGCYRCRDPTHVAFQCKAERCLDCGDFGHSARVCTSKNLPSHAKDQIRRSEASFENRKLTWPEKLRKKQLGEHDQKVPVVQSTKKDDAPSKMSNVQQKRKRDGSPPSGAKAPKLDHAAGKTSSKDENAKPTANGKPEEVDSNLGTQGPTNLPAGVPQGPRNPGRPPPPRKKKPVDPFIRPNRPRPRP